MEMKSEFIVLRNIGQNGFICGYENKKAGLAFNAQLSDDIEEALILPEKYYLQDKETYDGHGSDVGCGSNQG